MASSILVLITKPPYGYEEAFAGTRLGLGMLSSGNVEKCSILLVGDGTLNAIATQRPEAVRMPSNMEALQDMTDFDSKVYCVRSDLEERVGDVKTLGFIEMIDWETARKVLAEHEMVTTF
ncbi:MAG: sulfur relay protein TusC [Methanomassiliicoccales archaeon PtaU1.Bin124]|nr:MAG: sulfur relay protein TusC [Methanomassiliicoccales archaeon PtaU1.Bin124]